MSEKVLSFGPFQLFRSQKILREHGRPVRLGSRAMDLLVALVERAGEVVGKAELMDYAWPNTVVEENNLRVHLTAIRKMLGDGIGDTRYIINVAGRGYSFVAPVTQIDARLPEKEAAPKAGLTLPGPITRVLGRDAVIGRLVSQMPGRRLVTIVGPGGVGKSTVALAVAEQLAVSYDRVCFVDLSSVDDPARVPFALATVVGLSVTTEDPIANLISYLRDAKQLILLDNCEHVIARATELVERILRAAPGIDFLATSREPLFSEGEHVYELAPLENPPESWEQTVQSALQYSAVRLFVERATTGLDSFQLNENNVRSVAAICRRVEGIPLAIELVAARVSSFGPDMLAEGFTDNLLLTAKGKRTARSRHQSLRATLDWSYQLLSPLEQVILRRLSVFRGLFSPESAVAVVSGGASAAPVLDALMSLASKSLLLTDVTGSSIRYRFLQTTRTFAAERLEESNERNELLRRHAEHFRSLLEGALHSWETLSRQEWLAQYGAMIEDVRSAHDWAFSPSGNLELGAALTVASLPYGFQLALIQELIKRAQLTLETLGHLSPSQPLWELRINNFLLSLLFGTGAPEEALEVTAGRSLMAAKQTAIPRYLIEPLMIYTAISLDFGHYKRALNSAEELQAAARKVNDPAAILLADRVDAQVNQLLGNNARARSLAERVLRHPGRAIPLVYSQAPIDRKISMRHFLARILWLEGFPIQALRLVLEAVEMAKHDSPFSLCQVLGLSACPISLWCGDTELSAQLSQTMIDDARRFTLKRWIKVGLCHKTNALRALGKAAELDVEVDADERDGGPPLGGFYRDMMATSGDDWIDAATIARAESGQCGWAGPEIMRRIALLRFTAGTDDSAAFEARLKASIGLAAEQQALGWELRSMTSLARLWQEQGRREEGLKGLSEIYERFTEGHETPDLKRAQELIAELDRAPAGMPLATISRK